jgi:predicted transcriptional regulator
MEANGKVFSVRPSLSGTVDMHVGERLCDIRRAAGLTQVQLAARLQIDQAAISRLERREDILVSTLRSYIEALGGKLRIDASLGDRPFVVRSFEETSLRFEYADEDQFVLPIVGEDLFPPKRDIVFSVKPEYSEKIVSGIKTVELRRRFPGDVPLGTIALIYATTPTQALTGIAQIESVFSNPPEDIWEEFAEEACIRREEFDSYFAGTTIATAIKLRRARPLRRSLQLDELRERFNFEPPQSFLYATPQLREALSYQCSEISDRHKRPDRT